MVVALALDLVRLGAVELHDDPDDVGPELGVAEFEHAAALHAVVRRRGRRRSAAPDDIEHQAVRGGEHEVAHFHRTTHGDDELRLPAAGARLTAVTSPPPGLRPRAAPPSVARRERRSSEQRIMRYTRVMASRPPACGAREFPGVRTRSPDREHGVAGPDLHQPGAANLVTDPQLVPLAIGLLTKYHDTVVAVAAGSGRPRPARDRPISGPVVLLLSSELNGSRGPPGRRRSRASPRSPAPSGQRIGHRRLPLAPRVGRGAVGRRRGGGQRALAPVSATIAVALGRAARGAARRLSLWARIAASCASAAWAVRLVPGRRAAARAASRANPSRRYEPLACPSGYGRLDVGADLELGLQQRAAGVAERLGRGGVGLVELQVVGHDDPLQARDVGQELADLDRSRPMTDMLYL